MTKEQIIKLINSGLITNVVYPELLLDKSEYDLCEQIIHDWEQRTGLEMEIDKCSRLIQRDVSNYILIKE